AAAPDRATSAGGLPALDAVAQSDGAQPVSRRDRDIDGPADAMDHAWRDAAAGSLDRGGCLAAQAAATGLAGHRLVLCRAVTDCHRHSAGTRLRTAYVFRVDRRVAGGGRIAAGSALEDCAADPARVHRPGCAAVVLGSHQPARPGMVEPVATRHRGGQPTPGI